MRFLFGLFMFGLLAACGEFPKFGERKSDVETSEPLVIESGVSLELAQSRAAILSDLNYDIEFRVPAEPDAAIQANQTITFTLSDVAESLQLDFKEAGESILRLRVNGEDYSITHENEHLIVPAAGLQRGANTVEIDFIAGDTSLNRNPDYLYTLFVPDRARTAFPVFEQPNLKATFELTLDLPASWKALGNAPVLRVDAAAPGAPGSDRRIHRFQRSDLLSTYLFSFVAGEFEAITRTVDGREMTMLHRETDEEKVVRNVDAIFQLHADALAWLEDYTGIDYPFAKFDFAAIPTFQYGGMEHVGAIQYRASTLFLDADPSDPQLLGRANLIAHETAHMWFGDLVTMDWFNDVWTKEVFANFMASKIVNPGFPNIDHDLNFLLRSYPAAYAVDRSSGANPIRQNLPNLDEAGTLYGGIIYNKAPIMMSQLEALIGEDVFRDGIREYLTRFAGSNATWPDLIDILDGKTDKDLKTWSEVWVATAGRPVFRLTDEGTILRQSDPAGDGRLWQQAFGLSSLANPSETFSVLFDRRAIELLEVAGEQTLVNSDGRGYGLFPVATASLQARWRNLSDLQTGALLINLYEQMLEGHEAVTPEVYFDKLMIEVAGETNELLLNTMLGQMRRIYWSFLSEDKRSAVLPDFEAMLWRGVGTRQRPPSTRKIYLRTLQDVAMSSGSLERLTDLWRGTRPLAGITLSERERTALVGLLALKRADIAVAMLEEHIAFIENPDARRRFAFIRPALSPDQAERDAFFRSLADLENRAIESWVVDALGYLHHPLRVEASADYLGPSLALIEEIQVTGDIFFPERWASATLQNHRSSEAAETVRAFLRERRDYNAQLRLKILQGADMLFRAERLNIAPIE